jgi:hypothetical protein
MKNLLKVVFLSTVFLFSTTSFAHHAAAGIVSDDIWQMVDDLLVAADSPHLDMDFTLMDSTVVTTIEVETSMVNDIIAALETLNNGQLMVSTTPTDPGLTLITIVETVGSGKSQIVYM